MYLDVLNRNPYSTNCWLLGAADGVEAVVVDPGFDPVAVRAELSRAGRTPVAVLATHGHADHVGTAGVLCGDELPLFVHAADVPAFTDEAAWDAGFPNPVSPVTDLRTIADGDVLRFAGFSFEVLHTPGHTPGHCVFRTDAVLLSGDLVFAGSIGRSDFPNSSPEDMRRSLGRFLALPDDLPVLPGHGPTTTVGRERASNQFLVELV
jgi:glyoxylase-like metal-dependent hydrolase (beta-lactamase superfamily II)